MIIRNLNTLKAMEKAGSIKLHEETGTIVNNAFGGKVKAYYIEDGKTRFTYKNQSYKTQYLDGCFFPFVFQE